LTLMEFTISSEIKMFDRRYVVKFVELATMRERVVAWGRYKDAIEDIEYLKGIMVEGFAIETWVEG
jgi:hypothetical protein